MARFDLQPTRDGARIALISDNGTSVSTDRDRDQVAQFVTHLCMVAGLPEPWKG